jgi:hypothetical protein
MFCFVFILFICGNIELNPGLKSTTSSNSDNSSYFSCERDSVDGNPYASDSNQLNSNKGFKIIHLNVQIIRNKLDEIKTYCLFLKPDILSLTETWLKSEGYDYEFDITGYGKFRRDRNTNKKSGGVLVYHKLNQSFKVSQYLDNEYNFECICLKVSQLNTKHFFLLTVYKSPPENQIVFQT